MTTAVAAPDVLADQGLALAMEFVATGQVRKIQLLRPDALIRLADPFHPNGDLSFEWFHIISSCLEERGMVAVVLDEAEMPDFPDDFNRTQTHAVISFERFNDSRRLHFIVVPAYPYILPITRLSFLP